MSDNYNISVIIPTYNAERFLRRAIESVLIQPEVDEILLIEDCSPDNSIVICEEYIQKYPDKIKLFKHPENKNMGAPKSRNLGIKKAKNELIAFLDSDDFYLPERFTQSIKLLRENPELDGVHSILGLHFETEEAKKLIDKDDRFKAPTGLKIDCTPEDLFYTLIQGIHGHIHINTILVKKSLVEKCGYFHERLLQGQDTELILRLAAVGKLAQNKQIIGLRGVHSENRIHDRLKARSYHVQVIPYFLKWGKNLPKLNQNSDFLSKDVILT